MYRSVERAELHWLQGQPIGPGNPRPLNDEHATTQLRRCLQDDALPLVRVAGAVVILYGVRVSRLVQLTADDLEQCDGNTYLHAGRAAIHLPPPLDDLLARLAAGPLDPSPLSRAVGPNRHLFSGAAAGRPIRATGLHKRLRRHGITAEPGRHTALLALAAKLPAPILADLLGVQVATILRWAAHSGGAWTPYIAARATS